VAYTIFGDAFNRVANYLFVGLLLMGVFFWAGWFVFAGLVWFIGAKHPEIVHDGPVRGKGTWLGWASLFMFVTTFSPAPIQGGSLLELLGWHLF